MNTSRWSMVIGILPLAGALALFAGCNGPATADEDTAAAPSPIAAEAPAKMAEKGRMGGMRGAHGPEMMGPAHLLGVALHTLDLSDAQRATIQGEMDALHASAAEAKPDRAAFDAHRAALAAAVRSGKIDERAIPAPPAFEGRDPARVAKALQVLHDTLTADQRQKLVDAEAAKMGERPFGPMHERGEPGKHGRGGEMGGPLGHMLHDLDLTDAQREKVREAMKSMHPSEADRDAMKAQHEAFATAMKARLQTFAADSFDAAAFAAPPKDAPAFGPGMGPGKMIKVLAAVVPILDEAQRAELAKRIEQGPGGDMPCEGKHEKR